MGCTRTIHTLCHLLSLERDKSNIYKIWQCKIANQDTYCSININWIYLFFDSFQECLSYVESSDDSQREDLLERIKSDRETWLTVEKFKTLSGDKHKIKAEYIRWG